ERRAPATLPLAAAPMPARLVVTVGGDAVARVRVRRGDAPQAGVPLILRGSSGIPGGPPQDAQTVTDASGTAVFRFPVGRVPATLRRSGGPRSVSSGPRCGAEGTSRSAFEGSRSDRWTWFGPTGWRPRLRASSPARDNGALRGLG